MQSLLTKLLVLLSCTGCASSLSVDNLALDNHPVPESPLLFIGQDMQSVSDYVDSGYFPEPDGVTTYLAFYRLTQTTFPSFGALGQDVDGDATGIDVNWGAGPLNADRLARDHPDAAIAIGLNIAEGSGETIWTLGGLADIPVGVFDKNIERLAVFCRDIKRPIYLRIGYEFDGAWNRGYENTTGYILAYRHIVDVMRKAGVNNVRYVWQASASPLDDILDGYHEDIRDWYPGDEYVDWMGLSWFLAPDEKHGSAPTQRQLADEVLVFARERDKPVMIAEASPQGYNLDELTFSNRSPLLDGRSGEDKETKTAKAIWQEWFQPLFDYIRANTDVIRAVAYINANWDAQPMWSAPYNQGYWGDARLQVNPEIRRRWLAEILNAS